MTYVWCDVTTFLNGFDIIPSKPLQAALDNSNFSLLRQGSLICIGMSWTLFMRTWTGYRRLEGEPYRGLRELSVIGWPFHANDVCGPFV